MHTICLTSCALAPSHLLVDQAPQLPQQVGTEEGSPRANRDHRIGRVDVGPFNQQRAQPPFCVHIGHAVLAPVVPYDEDFEALAPQWMERVGDRENLYATITTVCSARFSPKGKWNLVSATLRKRH